MCFPPLYAILAAAYKTKNKRRGNQHQGPVIDGERVVKSGGAKIIQTQKETPHGRYDTPLKDTAIIVIDDALNTTHTTEAHRVVSTVMKKRKSEADSAPTTNNVHLKQAGDQWEEAQLSISKHVMTNRPLLLAENIATSKAVPPDKYVGK